MDAVESKIIHEYNNTQPYTISEPGTITQGVYLDNSTSNAKRKLSSLEVGDFFVLDFSPVGTKFPYSIFFLTDKCNESNFTTKLYAIDDVDLNKITAYNLKPDTVVTLFTPTPEQKLLTIPFLT